MTFPTLRCLPLVLVTLLFTGYEGKEACGADASPPQVKRIVFLGDSITYAGGYIDAIETAILIQHPEMRLEILNLGLPSETTSGLSEPGHAGGSFPRPDVHERLERVLAKTKPDLVVACYGMNDGIYYPLGEDRFEAFKSGITRLHDAVEKAGAKIIHMTPAMFDALPIQKRLLPAGLAEYRQPYEGYDDVLEAYSAWLLEQQKEGWIVLDVHGAMKSALNERRKSDPSFTYSSDGVHPNDEGQAVLAQPLAALWGLQLDAHGLPPHPKANEVHAIVRKKQHTLKHAWLSETGHKRPGIGAGLPLAEAEAVAAKLDLEARQLISGN
jgi:lysophospholipase L1-like esterase